MKSVILIGKIGTLATWALLASNMFIPGFWANINADIGLYLNLGFIGMVLIHNFEALMFMNSNRNSNEPILLDGFQVFAYGVFHTMALKQNDTSQGSYSQAA